MVGGSVREFVSRLENEGRRKRGLGCISLLEINCTVMVEVKE